MAILRAYKHRFQWSPYPKVTISFLHIWMICVSCTWQGIFLWDSKFFLPLVLLPSCESVSCQCGLWEAVVSQSRWVPVSSIGDLSEVTAVSFSVGPDREIVGILGCPLVLTLKEKWSWRGLKNLRDDKTLTKNNTLQLRTNFMFKWDWHYLFFEHV